MWKIQLTIAIKFISSKDNDEECIMHSKSDNKEVMSNKKPDKVIKKLFKSVLNRYQKNLETSMGGSVFIFDYVHLLYYKCYKRNPNHVESFIYPPVWIKNKKATINAFNTL